SSLVRKRSLLRAPRELGECRLAFLDRTERALAGYGWRGEAVGGEIKNGVDLFAGEAVIECENLVDAEAVLQILKYGGYGHAGAAKNPSAAEFVRHAFDDCALRPVQGHGRKSSGVIKQSLAREEYVF